MVLILFHPKVITCWIFMYLLLETGENMYWIILSRCEIVLILLFTAIYRTTGIRCYVCGDPGSFPGVYRTSEHDLDRPSCDEFDKSEGEALKRFIVDCPKHYQGCITQKQGDNVLRACDTIAFDDCQSANGITYCYCSGNLCNYPGAMKLSTTSAAYIDLNKYADLADDEDYNEMSGDGAYADLDADEKSIIIKGNFETERINTTISEHTSSSIPNESITGNDLISAEDDSVHLVISLNSNQTTPDAISAERSSFEPDVASSSIETSHTTSSSTTETTEITTVSSIEHVANVKKSSTRLAGSNGDCRLTSSSARMLITLMIISLISY